MEENENNYIIHKIRNDYNYIVYRNENNGRVYYKIRLEQETVDGQKIIGYVQVRFAGDVDIPNKTKIKINKAIENFYFNKNDVRNYTPIFYYQINDFEVVDSDAIQNYNEAVANSDADELPF